ncbi:MAG: YlxR family protein [Actinobacteria bacterium]|nr:YlxR family protein [Actinomycetota bacterium]
MGSPRRTCVGCRRTTEASALVRVVRGEGGSIIVGPSSSGRGAWLCAGSSACLDLAQRHDAFSRAFRTRVSPEAAAALRDEMTGKR